VLQTTGQVLYGMAIGVETADRDALLCQQLSRRGADPRGRTGHYYCSHDPAVAPIPRLGLGAGLKLAGILRLRL
jgi:hypothetical protein